MKRKLLLKRAGAWLLAFAMVIGLMPQLGGAVPTAQAAAKVSYSFQNKNLREITYADGYGYEYLDDTVSAASVGGDKFGSLATGAAGEYIAYKLKVPQTGMYAVEQYCYYFRNQATINYHFIPISHYDAQADNLSALVKSGEYIINTIDTSAHPDGGNYHNNDPVGNAVFPETEGIFVMESATKGAMRVMILHLTYFEELKEIRAQNTTVAAGYKIEPELKWFNTAGLECAGETVQEKIEIIENNGALIESDGGIYAVAEGEATVRVTGKLASGEGGSKTAEFKVTVTPQEENRRAGAFRQYNFYLPLNAETEATNDYHTLPDCPEYDETAGRYWAFLGDRLAGSNGNKYYTGANNYASPMSTAAGDYFALKLKAPAKGLYEARIRQFYKSDQGTINYHFIPVSAYDAENNNLDELISEGEYVVKTLTVTSDSNRHTDFLGNIEFSEDCEYIFAMESVDGKYMRPIHLELDGVYAVSADTKLEYTQFGVGEQSRILSTDVMGNDGKAIADLSDACIVYSISESDADVAAIEDGVITALSEGKAVVDTVVIKDGAIIKAQKEIEVNNGYGIAGVEVLGRKQALPGDTFKISPVAVNGAGEHILSDDMVASYSIVEGGDIVSVSEGKVVAGAADGTAKVTASFTVRGKTVTSEPFELTVSSEYVPVAGASREFLFYPGANGGHPDYNGYLNQYPEYSKDEGRYWAFLSDNIAGVNGTKYSYFRQQSILYTTKPGEYTALKIDIPAAGRYAATLNVYRRKDTGIMELYAIPYNEDTAANPGAYMLDAYRIATEDLYNVNEFVDPVELDDIIFETAGEYILLIASAGTTGGLHYIRFNSLELDGESVTEKVEVTAATPYLGVNETTPFSIKAILSNGSEIPLEDAEVEITLDNPDVLTMDKENMTLRSKAEGVANIGVSVEYKGVKRQGSLKITVDDEFGINKEKGGYLYGETVTTVGGILSFVPAIELNNQNIVKVTDGTVKYEFLEGEGVIEALRDDGTFIARELGTARIVAHITTRGEGEENTYTTAPIDITVQEELPGSPNITINMTRNSGLTALEQSNKYTDSRRWIFEDLVGYAFNSTETVINDDGYTEIYFDSKAEDKYLALRINVPQAGNYRITSSEYKTYYGAGKFDMYIFPATAENAANIPAMLTPENYAGSMDNYSEKTALRVVNRTQTFAESYTFTEAGEYLVVLNVGEGKAIELGTGGYNFYLSGIYFNTFDRLNSAKLVPENGTITVGAQTTAQIKLYNAAGEEISCEPSEVFAQNWKSSDETIAMVSDAGVITGLSDGTVQISTVVTLDGNSALAVCDITVSDTAALKSIASEKAELEIYVYGSTPLELYATLENGQKIRVPGEYVTWAITPTSEPGIAELSGSTLTGKKLGTVTLQATVKAGWRDGAESLEIPQLTVNVIWDVEDAPTMYTLEKRENIQKNAERYSWARSQYDSVAKSGDYYVENIDALLDLVVPENVPRYSNVSEAFDPNQYICDYCGKNVSLNYGLYPWITDPINKPWKVQCPECRRSFPSNDFASFYKLGITESGAWNYEKAHREHYNMFKDEYVAAGFETFEEMFERRVNNKKMPNIGYLKNIDYPEKDTEYQTEGWLVDDGYGYYQTYVSDPTKVGYNAIYRNVDGLARHDKGWYSNYNYVRRSYISYFVFEGLWHVNGSNNKGIVMAALWALRDAFYYTGEAKYGRAGAILLDRVADAYPDYEWSNWIHYRNRDQYYGKVMDPVWENSGVSRGLAEAYDAFKPIYNDQYVIDALSERPRYEVNEEDGSWARDESGELIPVNLKDSPGAARKHIEDNVLREVHDAIIGNKIAGNFGMRQQTMATVALAMNKMPETGEWLDWLFSYGDVTSYVGYGPEHSGPLEGGDILHTIVNIVDRDGHGDENSPGYNILWVGNLIKMADKLAGYKLYPSADIFKNPKFIKMFTAQVPMLLGGHYYANNGDAASVLSGGAIMDFASCKTAFKHTGDRNLARALYFYNNTISNGSPDNFRGDIWDAEPEGYIKQIEKIVAEDGELVLGSRNLTGYGFAALRAGGKYKSATASETINTHRDFGIYHGANNHHGHADSLHLYMSAFGLNLGPDLGYPEMTGAQPNNIQWCINTLSHNTVVVDEKMQTGNTQRASSRHFDDSGRVKLMDVSTKPYTNVDDYRRSVIMIEAEGDISYGVDFFHVQGGSDHLYSFHSQSDELYEIYGLNDVEVQPSYTRADGTVVGTYAGPNVPFGADPGDVTNTTYPIGYTWLKNVRTYNSPDKEFAVEFKIKDWNNRLPVSKDIRLRLTMVNDKPFNEVSFTTGLPPQKSDNKRVGELEYLLVRNEGNNLNTTFTTVFEPYEEGAKYLKSVEKVSMVRDEAEKPGINDSYSAIKVVHTNGRVDYVMYSTNTDMDYVIDGKINFRGFAGVVTFESEQEDAKIIYSYLNDGDVLDVIGREEENSDDYPAAYTGTVKSFTTELAADNYITFTPDQEIDTEALADKYIYVANDGVRSGAYRIESAKYVGDDVELYIGDTTTIRGFLSQDSIHGGYTYDIAVGQSLRIPMSEVMDGAPEFTAQSDKSATAGKKLTVQVSAESPLGKALTYSAVSLPRGASFDAASRTLTWTPDEKQIGTHAVGIKVSDGSLSTNQYIEIEVYKSAGSVTETPSTDTGSDTPSTGTDTGSGSGSGGGGGGGGAGGGGSSSGGDTSADTGSTDDTTDTGNNNAGDGTTDVPSERFIDLGNHTWAKDAIYALVDAGVVNGTSANTYSPANNIKRADFAIMLVRAFGITEGEGEGFADVDANKYYAEELRLAKAAGIVNGIGENKFNPEGEITRQDMMLMLARALDAVEYELSDADQSVLAQFTDAAQISDYAADAVSRVVKSGIIAGANGRINPLAKATRAEVAVMLSRVIKK